MALSPCNITVNEHGLELVKHGTTLFPVACYHDDLTIQPVPWHWHEEFEAVLVTEGTAVITSGNKKQIVTAGNGMFTNSGVLHADWNYDTSSCRFHSIVFHPSLVGGSPDSIFWHKYLYPLINDKSIDGIYLDCEIPWQKEALDSIESAWQSCSNEHSGYEFSTRDALSRLLCLLVTNLPALENVPSFKSLRDRERIKQMMQYIQAHYSAPLTVKKIAASASISESECLRCFHNTIHITPIQYVKQFRVHKAAELLLSTEEKIIHICFQCGFQEMSYFSKVFRTIYGVTPSEYRHQKKKVK